MKKLGMTGAESFWYVVGCIAFASAYFAKVVAKKATADYGLTQLTGAERFWYVLGCIAFGAMYIAKLPAAKALSELPEIVRARQAALDAARIAPEAITA